MGEGARRKAWAARVRAGGEECIYCGAPSATVEHMPAKSLFISSDRPSGMEFACCGACNAGTRLADQLAAFALRIQLDGFTEVEKREWEEYAVAAENNNPGLIRSMQMPRGAEKIALSQAGLPHDYGLIQVPQVMHEAMLITSAKLGFAVYHEVTQTRVPDDGGVVALWASNQQTLTGNPFGGIDRFLGSQRLIRQGRKTSSGQFWYYASRSVEGYVVVKGHWRKSGAVTLAVAGSGLSFLRWGQGRFDSSHFFAPGDFVQLPTAT